MPRSIRESLESQPLSGLVLAASAPPTVCSRKPQSIARANFTNACFISMIWSSRERNRSRSLVSRRSRGRIANPPLHQLEREESRLAIRGNPQNRICKKIALQRPKTGKFDYLSGPNHPAHSIAFKFFTNDCFKLAAQQSHQHDIVIAAAKERVLSLDPFLDKAERTIETQRPLVVRDDSQVEPIQVEGPERVVCDERECVLGQPPALPAALADQDSEFSIADKPVY